MPTLSTKERDVLNAIVMPRAFGLVSWIALIVAIISLLANVVQAVWCATLEARIQRIIEDRQESDPTYQSMASWQTSHAVFSGGAGAYVPEHSHAWEVSTCSSVPGWGVPHFSSLPSGDTKLATGFVRDHPLSTSDCLRTFRDSELFGGQSGALRHSTVGTVVSPDRGSWNE